MPGVEKPSTACMERGQKIFNFVIGIVVVILLADVVYVHWQLLTLQAALDNRGSQGPAENLVPKMNGNLERLKRQVEMDIPSTTYSSSANPPSGAAHTRHERLQQEVNELRETSKLYSAHMKLCATCPIAAEGSNRHYRTRRGFLVYPSDFAQWTDAGVQGRNNRAVPSMHTANSMSSPIIPFGGLYHVYGQVTWLGKPNATHGSIGESMKKEASFSIVVVPGENSRTEERPLLTSLCTQDNLGKRLNISYRVSGHPDDFPVDSAFVSGYFYLGAGQILAMKLKAYGNHIDYGQDRTFFGYRLAERY